MCVRINSVSALVDTVLIDAYFDEGVLSMDPQMRVTNEDEGKHHYAHPRC